MYFRQHLQNHLKLHPHIQPQDIVKLCYQAAYGAEHLLADISSAEKYFFSEYEKTLSSDCVLYESISSSVCRVNLSAWKFSGMPAQWLFRMFVNSAHIFPDGKELFEEYLEAANEIVKNQELCFSFKDWKTYLEHYRQIGMQSVHHSELYRNSEHPAYRIVHNRFIRLLPILEKASLLPGKSTTNIIAIDGRAASGKSTIADDLKLILNGSIVHMDDFFLPPELRTEERFSEAGGNIHYERFKLKVLPFLRDTDSFSYLTFDCQKRDYGNHRFVENSKWRIVEGAYSHHPYFGEYADVRVFSDICPEKQMERIQKRDGEWMAERFRTEWIPLEEKYYDYYQIKKRSDVVISAEGTLRLHPY